MNLNCKERKLVLKWFELADEASTLTDADLKLYDKIRDSVDDEDCESSDPLFFRHKKCSDAADVEVDDLDSVDFEDSFSGLDDNFDSDESVDGY